MGSFSKFRLRWNNHLTNFVGSLGSVLKSENYSDVTVYCEGHVWQLHRLVLSASSSHFDQLLNSIPIGLTPALILDGPSASDIEAIIHFIYHGEVSIHQDLLPSLLRTASSLKIKGLTEVSLVDSETQTDQSSVSLNYCNSITGKMDRMCHPIEHIGPDKSTTILSEAYDLSPLNLSRHQSEYKRKHEDIKRIEYLNNNSYEYDHHRYHDVPEDIVSPLSCKRLRSCDRDNISCEAFVNGKAYHDDLPYDLSTNSPVLNTDQDVQYFKIKEERNNIDEIKIINISETTLHNGSTTPTNGEISYDIPVSKIETVQVVGTSQIDEYKLSPRQAIDSENYVHIKKRITNMEKQNQHNNNNNIYKYSQTPENKAVIEADIPKLPTYSDAGVSPTDEITGTFNHKKFSHCTILSSGDAIHVVRGVYNPNLLNGSSYKIVNPKVDPEDEGFVQAPSQPVISMSQPTISSSVPRTTASSLPKEGINGSNSSLLLVSSTSSSASSPINEVVNSPDAKADDKSTGDASDNDNCNESSLTLSAGSSCDGNSQISQRVTINMRTFKEEWRKQLLVDYDSRTNMSICMLCFTTFKSYDGPRKNTYVKHAKRFHPNLEDFSEEEREAIINMYEKYHKYDINMQKEINKSFRTPNGPGCISKRTGKIIDPASLLSYAQNKATFQKESIANTDQLDATDEPSLTKENSVSNGLHKCTTDLKTSKAYSVDSADIKTRATVLEEAPATRRKSG